MAAADARPVGTSVVSPTVNVTKKHHTKMAPVGRKPMTDLADQHSVTLAEVMLPAQANAWGTVHGGEIMKLMDTAAGCAAIRFAKMTVVTARVDELQFIEPVHISSYVTCMAEVVYTGRTSVEVFVTVDVEDLLGTQPKHRALSAYFTMVAVDSHGRPQPVPRFTPETPAEIERWQAVEQRRSISRQVRHRRSDSPAQPDE